VSRFILRFTEIKITVIEQLKSKYDIFRSTKFRRREAMDLKKEKNFFETQVKQHRSKCAENVQSKGAQS